MADQADVARAPPHENGADMPAKPRPLVIPLAAGNSAACMSRRSMLPIQPPPLVKNLAVSEAGSDIC